MMSIIQELNIMIEGIYELMPDSESIEETNDLELNLKAINYIKDNIIKSRELYRNYGVSFDKGEHNSSTDKLIMNQILLNISYFNGSNKDFVKYVRSIIDVLFKNIKENKYEISKVEYILQNTTYAQVFNNLTDLHVGIAELKHNGRPYGVSKYIYYTNGECSIEDNIRI